MKYQHQGNARSRVGVEPPVTLENTVITFVKKYKKALHCKFLPCII